MNRASALLCLATMSVAASPLAHAQDSAKPVHGYRVVYTLTTTDAGKRSDSSTFSMNVTTSTITFSNGKTVSGRGSIKVGQKVPVATGSYGDAKTGVQTQFTYIDVGINIDATVTETPNGLLVASKLEQSSVAPEPVVISGVAEPMIRQVVLENSSTLAAGRNMKIGALDLPDAHRHTDVEVSVEPLP